MSEENISSSDWTQNDPLFGMSFGETEREEDPPAMDVVLGGGTPLGASLSRNLAEAGRSVRAVLTTPMTEGTSLSPSVEAVMGNPLDPRVIEKTCADSETIYICLEFPHHDWKTLAHRVLNNAVCYAIENSKRIFLASPIYDAQSFRNSFDQQTLGAHREGFIQVLVARLPQLYGPGVRNVLFDEVYDSVLSEKTKAHWVGDLDVPRDLLYIEDAGRACAALGMSPMAYGRKWDVSQGTPITGRQFLEHAFAMAGKTPDIRKWRNGLLRIGGILDYDSKEMAELPYDYSKPMMVDGTDFIQHFPDFEFTPVDVGLRTNFEWYQSFLKPHTRLQRYLPLSSLPV